MPDLQTVKQFLEHTKSCFLAFEDVYDAKVDAQVLLCAVLDKDITFLLTWPDSILTEPQKSLLLSFIERRCHGEPVAYIIGKREFWSLDFLVAPCTLIPRPDTEILVENVLDRHQDKPQLRLLDLGTGTGAIALALANENSKWQVEAVDFNEQAVVLAQTNQKQLNIENATIYQSDWFKQVSLDKPFDVIVSNPPYIDANDKHLKEGDVRFEPLSALVAEDKGLADIRHIIDNARTYLSANGELYLEHGFEQHQGVQQILLEFGYADIQTFNDYGGNPRITMGVFKR